MAEDLPVHRFKSARALRTWLSKHHGTSSGIWVRVFKAGSGKPTVTFEEALAQGFCYRWSEGGRRKFDDDSYLQRFTPRRTVGTTSKRNRALVQRLIDSGKMTSFGLLALGPEDDQ